MFHPSNRALAPFATAILFACVAPHIVVAQSVPAPSQKTPATIPVSWNTSVQGKRITAMCEDKRGRVFVASEENGVWMRGKQGAWSGFTPKNSRIASDMIYALAVDGQGRVWAGTARNGISVFNGRAWKNYDVLQAPIGERIFDIAVSPLDGDVWIASNIGLTRHSHKTDKWTTLYPTAKLPFNHLQSLAFTSSGALLLGTQTQGVLISQPQKNASTANIEYSKWCTVSAPSVVPDIASGTGLPSNMVNDILVARDKTVYVATTSGLAWSRNNGATWNYKRGADYIEKAKQRLVPVVFKESPSAEGTLNEDYVTSLAQDIGGNIWIGHWRQSYEVWDAQLQKRVINGQPANDWDKVTVFDDALSNSGGDYVKCILPMQNGTPLIGRYGIGLTVAPMKFEATQTATTKLATAKTPTSSTQSVASADASTYLAPLPFPATQAAPTLAELNALLKQLAVVPASANKNAPQVVALDDDWNTRGDWLGRYGKYWAKLSAMIRVEDGGDYIWGAGYKRVRYHSRIGPNADKNDAIRYWVHWLYTDNPNTLEIPPVYLHSRVLKGYTNWENNRRQSEIDDHGEAYDYRKDGPNVYVSLQVPKGDFVMSLYNFNKDGDSGDNRKRDYRVSIRPHNTSKSLEDIDDFWQQPELASARFRDFRSSVYKRFLIRGPQQLTIEVNKKYSLNTILAGVMLDEVKEKPAPYFRTVAQDRVLDAKLERAKTLRIEETLSTRSKRFAPATTEEGAANQLFAELDWLRVTNPTWWAQSSRKFYQPLTLWFAQQAKNDKLKEVKDKKHSATTAARLGTCYWALRMFEKGEEQQRKMGVVPARDVEKVIRWDEKNFKDSGSGYEIVTDFLRTAAQSTDKTVVVAKTKRVN